MQQAAHASREPLPLATAALANLALALLAWNLVLRLFFLLARGCAAGFS
ncbi:MAG TPA: hypothetical protein VGF34_04330 [Stellaceae bacterium]|jgi:hypothetical protein